MTSEPSAFDFRRPMRLPATVERAIAAWSAAVCKCAPEKLSRNLPFAPRLERTLLEATRQAEPPKLPEPAVVYRVLWGAAETPMLFLFARPLMLALAESLIGGTPEGPPADRELTSLELTLAESIMQDLVRALNEAQPGPEPPLCLLEGPEHRRQLRRLFPDDEELIHCRFEIHGPFGALPCSWLISMKAARRMVPLLAPAAEDPPAEQGRLSNEVVETIPAEVTIRLGGARIDVDRLATLQPGDVIVLDQRVTDPLIGQVGGLPKFLGWPGRVGARQAFMVSGT